MQVSSCMFHKDNIKEREWGNALGALCVIIISVKLNCSKMIFLRDTMLFLGLQCALSGKKLFN